MGAQPVKEPSMPRPVDVIDIVFGFAATHATCFTPLLRSRPGPRAYAIHGPLALLMMFVYSGFAECPELLLYLPVWLFFLLYRRVFANRAWHSAWQGVAWVAGFAGQHVARLFEPILLFLAGLSLVPVSEPLGNFVAAGAVSTFIVYMTERRSAEAQRRRMHDAKCEMELRSYIGKGGR